MNDLELTLLALGVVIFVYIVVKITTEKLPKE
jgi:hypothetical protein